MKIRIAIAVVAVVAAVIVIVLSMGITEYLSKGINYYVDKKYDNKVSVFAAQDDVVVGADSPANLIKGVITIAKVEKEGGKTKVYFAFKSKISYGGAVVLSARPLSGKKPYGTKVTYCGEELTFILQKMERDKVVAVYEYDGEIPSDALFVVTDVVVNEFSK